LHLTAKDMKGYGLVDSIVDEPDGGAHWDYRLAASNLKTQLTSSLNEIRDTDPDQRILDRINKFSRMGFWEENNHA